MRIFIVEDHEMFREVIKKVCLSSGRHEIVADVGTATEAHQEIAKHAPDLAVVDLALPDGDGFDIVTAGRASSPLTKYLLLSAHCDAYTVFRVHKTKIDGFVDKGTGSIHSLLSALAAIDEGGYYFSEGFTKRAASQLVDRNAFFNRLTDKEIAVLKLIALGMDDLEISASLGITRLTAKTHRGHILRKLHLPNTPKLIRYALEQGLFLFGRCSSYFN